MLTDCDGDHDDDECLEVLQQQPKRIRLSYHVTQEAIYNKTIPFPG